MPSQPKFLILADGDFQPMTSKTANSVIRYLPERVVGVVDRVAAGKTVQDVLGFGGAIPVVGSMAEGLALKPTAVMIGIAPAGGKLPEEWGTRVPATPGCSPPGRGRWAAGSWMSAGRRPTCRWRRDSPGRWTPMWSTRWGPTATSAR